MRRVDGCVRRVAGGSRGGEAAGGDAGGAGTARVGAGLPGGAASPSAPCPASAVGPVRPLAGTAECLPGVRASVAGGCVVQRRRRVRIAPRRYRGYGRACAALDRGLAAAGGIAVGVGRGAAAGAGKAALCRPRWLSTWRVDGSVRPATARRPAPARRGPVAAPPSRRAPRCRRRPARPDGRRPQPGAPRSRGSGRETRAPPSAAPPPAAPGPKTASSPLRSHASGANGSHARACDARPAWHHGTRGSRRTCSSGGAGRHAAAWPRDLPRSARETPHMTYPAPRGRQPASSAPRTRAPRHAPASSRGSPRSRHAERSPSCVRTSAARWSSGRHATSASSARTLVAHRDLPEQLDAGGLQAGLRACGPRARVVPPALRCAVGLAGQTQDCDCEDKNEQPRHGDHHDPSDGEHLLRRVRGCPVRVLGPVYTAPALPRRRHWG